MKIKIQKLHPDAQVPTYATPGAACFDLHAVGAQDVGVHYTEPVAFRTGLAFEVPTGSAMLVFSRSGHGFKHETRLANCVGVIDSDYRGELMVKLTRDPNAALMHPVRVNTGDRIGQALVLPVEQVQFVLSDELSETQRGTGGLGSTGA